MQTRRHSLREAWSNTAVGYFINVVAGLGIYPMFGAEFSIRQNLGIGLVFTVISVGRNYTVRRFFNRGAKT